MRVALIPFMCASLASAGCSTSQSLVRERASQDFSCDQRTIAVHELPDGTFEAEGCDQSGLYRCYPNDGWTECVPQEK